MKKTITICFEDDPTTSLCRGHVTAKVFNQAHQAEGWSGDPIRQDRLRYEYWIKNPTGHWKPSLPGKEGSVKVTVMYW